MPHGRGQGTPVPLKSERLLLLLEGLPHDLIGIIHHDQDSTVLKVNPAGHHPMPATTRHRTDTTRVQRGNDAVNTVVDALRAPIDRHAHLIPKRPLTPR